MGAKNSQSAVVGALAGSIVLSAVLGGLGLAAGIGILAKVTAVLPAPLTWLFGGSAVVYAVGALLFALVPLFLTKKVTDADKVSKYFGAGGSALVVIAAWQAIVAAGAIMLSLYSINAFDGVEGVQKPIWLGAFLPALVIALFTGAAGYLMKAVAAGKTALIGAVKAATLVMAAAAFVVVTIATIVTLHPSKDKPSTTKPTGPSYNDILDLLD